MGVRVREGTEMPLLPLPLLPLSLLCGSVLRGDGFSGRVVTNGRRLQWVTAGGDSSGGGCSGGGSGDSVNWS